MIFLLGDIGGTNTRLALAEVTHSNYKITKFINYSSQNYVNLNQIIDEFLSGNGIATNIDAACFAVAGPVDSERVEVTNLPWVLRVDELTTGLHTDNITLINDFISVAYGIAELSKTDMLTLQQGKDDPSMELSGNVAVIGAGTGLGAAHLVVDGDTYQAFSSETGHVGFAPENKLQDELLCWMRQTHSHVSLEMLLSGKGLLAIYRFFLQVKGYSESPLVSDAMQVMDPAVVITDNARKGDKLCQICLDCFVDIYGAAAGNVALNYYPISALYIAGGIALKIKEKLQERRFIGAFVNKGLMEKNLKNIRVKLIAQENIGVLGALSHARSLYR